VHGTIETLDADKQMVTIRLRDGSTRELTVNSDTTIRINGQPSVLADLKPGMEVETRYQTGTDAALRINTESSGEPPFAQVQGEIHGKVKEVNAFARQLVIETEDGKLVTVDLDIKAKIIKRGETIMLLSIKADTEVIVQLQDSASGNVAATAEEQ